MTDDHLERAAAALERGSETAVGEIKVQLESLDIGIEEEAGESSTGGEPGPKVDRVVEMVEKLEGLEEEAENEETAARVADARNHLRSYLKRHPQGG